MRKGSFSSLLMLLCVYRLALFCTCHVMSVRCRCAPRARIAVCVRELQKEIGNHSHTVAVTALARLDGNWSVTMEMTACSEDLAA